MFMQELMVIAVLQKCNDTLNWVCRCWHGASCMMPLHNFMQPLMVTPTIISVTTEGTAMVI